MCEHGGDPDLAEEALRPERRRQLGPQNLDGHLAVMLEILGEVDRRHASPAGLPHDAVARGQGSLKLLELLRVVAHGKRLHRWHPQDGVGESGRPAGSLPCPLRARGAHSLRGGRGTAMELVEQLAAALGDRYRVERELGHGGMAVVFLAEDLKHHRRVAIKLLRPELSAVLGSERFLREIEIAAALQHPHILPLFDSGQAAGLLYYVMPFAEGESLRQRLAREQQLPLDAALQITREVGSALQYAHEHGVVHRDIKPENIMLSGGQAVVADFGIARAVRAASAEALTLSGMVVGTPQYMSPEQAGGGAVDARSDQYSLACTLYEMLIGQPPFTGPSSQALIARHSLEPVPSLRVVRQTVPPWAAAGYAAGSARSHRQRRPR